MMQLSTFFQCLLLLIQGWAVHAQYPPSPSNITTLHSPVDGNITISFKSPAVGTCTTVFAEQKQYTGYVTLPPFVLAPIQQNYTVNTFFWFVEARTSPSTAPLTIYINGGPGSSSMVGLFQETGPCEVIEISQGVLGTQARDWGWDRSSNMLFIDQPNMVGFSYDTPTNGSLDLLNSQISIPGGQAPANQPAYTFLDGTFASNDAQNTANTTDIAALTVWHMLQGFLGAFPQYNPGTRPNSTQSGAVGINLFAESYGGKFGPVFARTWENQNTARSNGKLPQNTTLEINLSSLGIMQGCVDDLVQGRYYPIFANNNTYGIQTLSLVQEQTAAESYLAANGCSALIQTCRENANSMDPNDEGDVDVVNQACTNAMETCNNGVIGPYQTSGRDVYDISQMTPDPFPPGTYLEYLNSADVQSAIGVAVNYTESNSAVATAFQSTGDYDKGNQITDMAYLLSLGVRVALIYGDRDYICNWLGGEAVSFSIAAQSPSLAPFYSAGYAEIVTNSSYVGGVVRQYGNLSFSRIYDAGHLVPAYQPETAFTVFTRIILGTDISTGEPIDINTFVSQGDANATHQNTPPPQFAPKCWIREAETYCTEEELTMMQNGQGVVINGVLYDDVSDWQQPDPTVTQVAGWPGTLPPSMVPTPSSTAQTPNGKPMAPGPGVFAIPTGVFVATATPTSSSAAYPTAPPMAAAEHAMYYLSPVAAAVLADIMF